MSHACVCDNPGRLGDGERKWLKGDCRPSPEGFNTIIYASCVGGRVGWKKLLNDRQSTTKLVADL